MAVLFAAAACAGPVMAAACEGSKVLFTDEFEDDAGGWALNERVAIKGGDFTMALEPDEAHANLNVSHTVKEDVDICADAVWPKKEPGILGAGLLFWAEDASNYFQFGILNTGKYWIARKEDGRWQVIVQNVESDAIATEPGDSNVLRIKATGDHVRFFVNGEKLRELRGQQPKDGWRFGLSEDNFDKQTGEEIVFSSIKVTD